MHRDLKPDNLFVTGRGTLNIFNDFGLAKLKSPGYGDSSMTTIETSDPHKLIGTPAYMAPEQLRGKLVDERADIFAIGTVLYEMVSGRHPFIRESPAGTLGAILHEAAPPLEPPGAYPPSMERLLRHCLEKDPADRFQTAGDLAFALESILGELRQPAADVRPARDPQAISSVAVLPFADMSATRDQAYLCEGIAEELINVLARVPGLRVAARSSSFQFKGVGGGRARAVGARLGVAAVLEGGVRKAGDRLRVTVQLVDVADGYQRWSHRFDGKLEDVFAIQDEIAERVAAALGRLLTAHQREALRRPETAPETYEFFLRGRQLVNQARGQSFMIAQQMFEQAIERDRICAGVRGTGRRARLVLHVVGRQPVRLRGRGPRQPEGARAGARSPEAHTSRGFVLSLALQYEEAEREFQEALRLNPMSFEAYYIYARTCFGWGRIDRAAELFRRAAEVRHEDFQCLMLGSQALFMLGRKTEAVEANREGIRRAERQLELDPINTRALSLGSGALFEAGQRERAEEWLKRALEIDPDDGGVLANAACLESKSGRVEDALDVLERTIAKGWGKRDWIEHDPDYDPLRSHPRFQAMLEKLK